MTKAYAIRWKPQLRMYVDRKSVVCDLKTYIEYVKNQYAGRDIPWIEDIAKEYDEAGVHRTFRYHAGNKYGVAQLYATPAKAASIIKREGYPHAEVIEIELPD